MTEYFRIVQGEEKEREGERGNERKVSEKL